MKKKNKGTNKPKKNVPKNTGKPPVSKPKKGTANPAQIEPNQISKRKIDTWKIVAAAAVVISVFAGLFTVIVYWHEIMGYFKTPKEKYEDDNFVQGELKPPPLNMPDSSTTESKLNFSTEGVNDSFPIIKGILIKDFDKKKLIHFRIGNNMVVVAPTKLYQGFDILHDLFGDQEKIIIAGVNNDRLYVSVEFKDLQKEETIGSIEFNHWKLYKPNFLDFNNDDYKLEVKDKQNHIALSIKYNQDDSYPLVEICGYFIQINTAFVFCNDPVYNQKAINPAISKSDKDWKQQVQETIKHTTSIFPKSN